MSTTAGGAAQTALDRLRALLRQQIAAIEGSAWREFSRLADEVAAEAGRPLPDHADRAAAAELAHLQIRLMTALRARAAEAQERRLRATAASAYAIGGAAAT